MELIVLIGIATSLLIVIITLFFFQKKSSKPDAPAPAQRAVPVRPVEGIPRRAQIARNQRNRLRNNAAAAAENDEAEEVDEQATQGPVATHVMPDEKMGAKKRAKLEAKAEKRSHREHEMKVREEKKARDEKLEEERRRLDEKEAEEERKIAEAERLARQEAERKEHEEYMKLKAAFKIEEEGFDECEEDEKENLLAEFVEYIKNNKVVVLEDLAIHFKLKTQQAIDRITQLQADGILTGVIDDRGKFIYISEEELQAVAKFLKQRGRVSISELAECSNSLISLTPVN